MIYCIKSKKIIIFTVALFSFTLIFPVLAANLTFSFAEPVQILISSQTNKVFVLNRQSDEITIVDEKEKKIIASIPTGGRGSATMFFNQDGNLYVQNLGSENLTKFPGLALKENFDSDSIQQILKEREFIKTGSGFWSFNQDKVLQKDYVLNSGDGSLSVIDRKTRQKLTTLAVDRQSNGILVNSNTHRIYVPNGGGAGTLMVIDGEKNEPLKTIQITDRISLNFALTNESRDKIFISCRANNNIYIVDTLKDDLIAKIESGGKDPIFLSLNNLSKKLYVSNWLDASLSVIDAQNYKLLKKISLPAGAFPGSSTVDGENNLIFASNTGINSVSIIDGNQDEIIATLETGINPGRPVIHPQTKEIYIPNPQSNSITIISRAPDGGFQEQTIPDQKGVVLTGEKFSFPRRLALNKESNEVYILNNAGGNFLVLDAKTYKIKDKISVGTNPREILFVPELKKVFVSVGDEDKVVAYNVLDGSQKNIPTGDKPVYLLFNPQTKKLYTLNYNSYDLSVIDAEKETHLLDIPLGGRCEEIALNSKENKIYVAGLVNNEVVIIDGNSDEILDRIKVGLRPNRILYDEKFNRIYVANSASNDLTVIDGTTNQVIKTLKLDKPLAGLASGPEKNRIFGASPNENSIVVIDSENLEIISPDIRVAGNPSEIIFDSPKSMLFTISMISPNDFLTVVDLESQECPKFLNVAEAVMVLAGVPRGTMTDAVFNSQADKLFISLGGTNALAVIDVKNNEPRLEAVVSNKGITWAPLLPEEMTWSQKLLEFLKQNLIYILAGIILLIIIVYFVIRRLRTSPKSIS